MVVERHVAFGEALCHVLLERGYDVRHVPRPDAELVRRLHRSPPDLVVVGADPGGPDHERLAVVSGIAEIGIPVIGLTGHRDDPIRRRMLRHVGATAVVGRTDSLDVFVALVDRVVAGEDLPLDAAEEEDQARADELLRRQTQRLMSLSTREREVLEHLRLGRTPDEIARRDHVSVSTVRTQVSHVLRKLDVRSQLSAVALLRWVTEAQEGEQPRPGTLAP